MYVGRPYTRGDSSHIVTLVVVYDRAVTERQRHVRLVVAKDIILEAPRKGFGHKQCHPAPQYHRIFFERASCENSETSCSESRRKFDGVKLIRNKYSCMQANIADTTK